MKWQKVVRFLVAAVGLGTAAAMYFLARPRPVAPPPQAPVTIDPGVKVQTSAGKNIRTDGDRVIGTYTFAAMRSFEGDKMQLDGFRYDFADGGFMQADAVQSQGTSSSNSALPAEFTATGNVVFQNRSGVLLHSNDVVFNDATGIALMKGPVSFERGRTSGTGTDAVYEQKTGRFTLQQNTHVVFAPDDPATPPIDITSQSMLYASEGKTMMFDGNARITRPTETLSSNNTTLYFADDEKNFKTIELRDNSQVTPLPGKASDLPEMKAQDIDLNFYPNGTALQNARLNQQATMVLTNEVGRRSIEAGGITFATATDGKTLTRLNAWDRTVVKTPKNGTSPERRISANTLGAGVTAGQEQKGLTAARFDGRVEFSELVPGGSGKPDRQRTATAEVLVARVAGQFLDTIEEARFEQNVVFKDGDVKGNADIGTYRAAESTLDLRPFPQNAKLTPRVDDGTVLVDAKEFITVNLDTNDITARRDVSTVSAGQKTARASGPDKSAIFNTTDKLYGSGAEFSYKAAARETRYRGTATAPATLTQGNDSAVNGDDITFSDATQNLTVIGHVSTSFLMAPSAGDPAQRRYRAAADELHYVDAKRTATYTGKPAVLTSTDGGETRGGTLVLELAQESRTLRQLTATSAVRMTMAEGRLAEAESLLYDAVKDEYILRAPTVGQTLKLYVRDGDGATCTIQAGNFARFVGALGAIDFPAAENRVNTPGYSGQPCPPGMPPRRPSPAKK